MLFSQVPGLTEVKKVLTQAVYNNHSAHAQLFLGAEGALNLPLALAYATFLHCQNKTDTDACGACSACSKSLKYIHPDTHFVFPMGNIKGTKDEESFKIEKLKSWRNFLLQQPFGIMEDWANFYGGEDKQATISREESREIVKALALRPFESKNKVMIIWQPEFMHPSAANGILKILEEPSPNTFFILVTNAAERLLPTIISRTQVVTVPLLDDSTLENFLVDASIAKDARAIKVAQLADGNLNLALKISTQEEDNNTQLFIEWMRSCYRKDYLLLVGMAENFHALDKLAQRNMLSYSIHVLRETLLQLAGAESITRMRGDELQFVKNFGTILSWQKIEKSVELISDAIYHLDRNGSAKMIFLDLSVNLSKKMNIKEPLH
jgi:DNA polymerase III subunit delta'